VVPELDALARGAALEQVEHARERVLPAAERDDDVVVAVQILAAEHQSSTF
jgi:hypothetical protein